MLSKKWGSYVESDATGERIELIKKNGVFVMRLEVAEGRNKKSPGNEGGPGSRVMMEVDGIGEEGTGVIRRRMQNIVRPK